MQRRHFGAKIEKLLSHSSTHFARPSTIYLAPHTGPIQNVCFRIFAVRCTIPLTPKALEMFLRMTSPLCRVLVSET